MTLRIPAEWERHAAVCLAMPYLTEEWDDPEAAQRDVAGFARALALAGESVLLLVRDPYVATTARALLGETINTGAIRVVEASYGDCWTRDTAPVFGVRGNDERVALIFEFDGWGGKFDMPGDKTLGSRVAQLVGATPMPQRFVFEGGAMDVDGQGTAMISQCILDRNPSWDQATAEQTLRQALGMSRILWVGGVLQGDHTDGHVDTLARFVAPGHVVCAESGPEHVNYDVLEQVADTLLGATDALGRPLKISRIPSPSAHSPASYCNFYIAGRAVLVPAYGLDSDEPARLRLAELFPDHEAVSVGARGLIAGGGALHCASQQVPS